MNHYITHTELLTLLAAFWLPVFALAAIIQWRILAGRPSAKSFLTIAVIVESALSFGIWLSPLHKLFFSLNFLGGFTIGSIPLQAAILASAVVTAFIWGMRQLGENNAL